MMSDELDIKSLAADLRVVRVRYELPDTAAFVRYQPAYDEDPNNLKVHHYDGELPLSCSETGSFNLKELVNELRYAYLEFIGGSYDFNRLWITSGISNLGVPMAIFLGKRHAVNGQPSVSLVDHRVQTAGKLVYRAIGGAGLNPTMAMTALTVITLFLLFGVFVPETAASWFVGAKDQIIAGFKWYYILVVALFLFFAVYLMFSRFGSIRLGDDDQANPFITEGMTPEAAQIAMRLTFFHWGLHPWAIYVIVGLSLAFFSYRRKLPLAIRSVLYPLLGDRIYGFWGHAADVLAVFGTVFGVATSLGLGVSQMNTGLNQMFGMAVSQSNQLWLIGGISLIATLSAVSGVGRGVKILSELNIWLSVFVLALFLVLGPTTYILNAYVQNIGDYLQNIVKLSFWTNTEANGTSAWQSSWTAFYWGWWIAWGAVCRHVYRPYLQGANHPRVCARRATGAFAARHVLAHRVWRYGDESGVVWWRRRGRGGQSGCDVGALQDGRTAALGDLRLIAKGVLTLLICTYFITSSDSGTLVITTLLSIGDQDPPVPHRALWGLGQGLVAAILLVSGGLAALQAASIIAALPFSVIMLAMLLFADAGAQTGEPAPVFEYRQNLKRHDGSSHMSLLERIGPA
ncbi:UNVERIFIED_CONTAM: hypothetical protein K2H54_000129 [Gekko kuhli]